MKLKMMARQCMYRRLQPRFLIMCLIGLNQLEKPKISNWLKTLRNPPNSPNAQMPFNFPQTVAKTSSQIHQLTI